MQLKNIISYTVVIPMNISSTAQPQVYYAYYSSDSRVSVQFLFSLCTTISFGPFDIPRDLINVPLPARLPGVIRFPSKHGGTSMKTAVISETNFCLLQTHLFSEGLCLSMSHNARCWCGFCCTNRLIRTGLRRHLALVMATVFQTFGGSATHLNNS